jgi:serine/threonine protein phosphatase PrpC
MSLFSSSLFCGNNKSSVSNTNSNNKFVTKKDESNTGDFSNINISSKENTTKISQISLLENKDYHAITDQNYPYKNSNEDFVYTELKLLDIDNLSLFALYDGHGGIEAVEYVHKRIPDLVKSKLKSNLSEKLNKEIKDEEIIEILQSCFKEVNRELRFTAPDTVGTTATVVVTKSNKVICANVGDSSAYLYNSLTSTTKSLTETHLASNESEKTRILKSGGKVEKGRVNGVLVVTRSLGDHMLQDKGVISDAYVSVNTYSKSEDYLIICSDGVWDVINQTMLSEYIKKDMSCIEICLTLLEDSKKLGSKDNISLVVVKL